MLRIFNFVTGRKPGIIGKEERWIICFSKDLDILSHVCSRWRQIALASSALWSHIDLAHHHHLDPGLIARAKEYATRARRLPLGIHIIDPYFDHHAIPPADIDNLNFLPPDTPIRSLELVSYRSFRDSHFVLLRYYFENCVPSQLKQLTIWCASDPQGGFLESTERPKQPNTPQIDMRESHLEAFLAQISVLQLNGLCFRWTSKAYHNLVDLRLCFDLTYLPTTISESQLVEIIKSSPRLRIFHVCLRITDPLPIDSPVLPVRLDDLEVFHLQTRWRDELTTFIRWIEPGAKPLQLFITSWLSEQLDRFFAHSNVTRLRIFSPGGNSLNYILSRIPQLRVLIVDDYTTEEVGVMSLMSDHIPPVKLEVLYLIGGTIRRTELRQLVEQYSVQRLVISETMVMQDDTDHEVDDIPGLRQELLSCPVFEYYTEELEPPGPMSHWDDLDGPCY
ncbi:F-box-like domain containing protein [Ceratobasidium theobromae]|uniref:F-box-like domain containing protein n=1 Tax=Ceratobasidium theobromae TaxID=1582974 RepID=A0A5N5QFX4_9AGAM|nr:F-box-like domain containing protein [Ceratobasidium theobromae]